MKIKEECKVDEIVTIECKYKVCCIIQMPIVNANAWELSNNQQIWLFL